LALAVAAGALVWRSVVIGSSPVPERDPPNLIVILTDDQRWDTMWAMPNVLRLLGENGVTFEEAFTTTPLCCPSRASLLTGQYSRRTGVVDNMPPDGGAAAFSDRHSLATWLQEAGYTTGLVGKYLNHYEDLGAGYVPPGWDLWLAFVKEADHSFYDYRLSENGTAVRYGHTDDDYSTAVLAARAAGFVEGSPEPFFLLLAPVAPHQPGTPAPRDVGRFAGRPLHRPPSFNEPEDTDKPYAGTFPPLDEGDQQRIRRDQQEALESLLAVDRAVGDLMTALESSRRLDRTVIVFTSDNGYLWGEHRIEGKIWPYEEAIRVPLVVRGPWIPTGRADGHLVLNVDLAPTLAELAGASPTLDMDGRSLVPLLEGQTPPWRTDFLVEFLGEGSAPWTERYEAVRTERHLYVEYRNGWRELYDLGSDPYQLENVVDAPGQEDVVARLSDRLRQLAGPSGPAG
jgi:N-acetylglucosamine-6-sulfatase